MMKTLMLAVLLVTVCLAVSTLFVTRHRPSQTELAPSEQFPGSILVAENRSAQWLTYSDTEFGFKFQYPPGSAVYSRNNTSGAHHLRSYLITGSLKQYMDVFKKTDEQDLLMWYADLYTKPIRPLSQAEVTKQGDLMLLRGTLPDGQKVFLANRGSIAVLLDITPPAGQRELSHSQTEFLRSITFLEERQS
jgi:hypothetical protein